MCRAAMLLLLALCAAPAWADGQSDLVIQSGRLGVMMDQSGRILPNIPKPGQGPSLDTPSGTHAYVFATLVSAVLTYNALADRACADGVLGGDLCRGPYLPAWLGRKASDVSDTQLNAMVDEASARLVPFWSALCAKSPEQGGAGAVCPME